MNIQMQAQNGDGEVTTIPTWLWMSIGAVALLTTGALGTWFGSTLMAHDRAIVAMQGQITRAERDIASIDVKFDRIWGKLEQLDKGRQ
jgi:hypothetical protein